jgi:signal transduction histidine kinase
MGEMLNSIAHQWRQPLNRINSNVAVIRSALRRNSINQEMLVSQTKMIEHNTKYMSDTINDFTNFFHPEKKETVFLIHKTITKALELINQRNNIVDINIISTKKIELFSFEKEYLQVLLIILNNAIDIFESKKIQKPKIDIIMEEYEDKVSLYIYNNGGAIDEEKINKIFDPYYTTKFSKEGTGLGLYVAKMLVENSMRGQLVAINIKEGVSFEISIPIRRDLCLI